MLVEAVFAAALKASIVLPDVGLNALSVGVKAEEFQWGIRIDRMNHSRLAVISSCLATINPYWLCVVHGDCPSRG